MVNVDDIYQLIVENVIAFAPKLLLAIITIIVGFWIAKKLVNAIEVGLTKKKVDASLKHFLESLVSIILKIIVILAAIGILGVQTTSFVAILAAAGFAVGFALQGSLSNFAGGVMILLFKPYQIGDFVSVNGESGTVHKIDVLMTILKTPQNVTIYIPNGPAFAGTITNYSQEEVRRLDMNLGISYNSDMKKAKEILEKTLRADERILKEPDEVFVAVTELADSAVILTTRSWVNGADFWSVKFDMQEKIKEEFDKAKIEIPFPQMDLHIKKE